MAQLGLGQLRGVPRHCQISRTYPGQSKGKHIHYLLEEGDSERFFAEIKRLADMFLQRCPDEKKLLGLIQKVGKRPYLLGLKNHGGRSADT